MRIDDWMYSEFWAALSSADKRVEIAKYSQRVRDLGLPVIIEGPGGSDVEWSLQAGELELDARGQCHLCRRSFIDPTSMRYWVRIIDPHYHEGFIDLGGVACQCPHIFRELKKKTERTKKPASTYYQSQ